MRVAFLVPRFPQLSETFIIHQALGLLERGHDVHVIGQRPTEPDVTIREDLAARVRYEPTCRTSRLPRTAHGGRLLLTHAWRHPKLLRTINPGRFGRYAVSCSLLHAAIPWLRDGAFDIIHAHFGPTALHGAMLRRAGICSGRFVATFYGHDVTRYPRRRGDDVYAPLFAEADAVLGLSAFMRDQLIALGSNPARTHVNFNSVDVESFEASERPQTNDRLVQLLAVGRMVPKKGFADAIRAVAPLRDHAVPWTLRIIGDGPLRDELESLAHEFDLGDRIEFSGAQSHDVVRDALHACDIVLAPSVTAEDGDTEGLPTVILEAMATGRPVISTRHSAIPELVEDGVSGLLVDERDVGALTEAVASVLDDPGRRASMGEAGRARVCAQFSRRRQIDELEALYARLLGCAEREGSG